MAIPPNAVFVMFDGCRFTPTMLADFQRMDADFDAEFRLHLLPSSAIRFKSEQEAIFRARYVPISQVGGRHVYDTRMWQGVRWARISPAGTVAAPDSPLANHVVENTGSGAVDIRDSGAGAGVMTAGSKRANWLRANAHRFNFSPEGYNFGEPWHYKYTGNLWGAAPADTGDATPFPNPTPGTPPAPVPEEEDDMADRLIYWTDSDTTAGNIKGFALVNLAGRVFSDWLGGGGTYANGIAASFQTGDAAFFTKSGFEKLRADITKAS